jgi:hypothetical protein
LKPLKAQRDLKVDALAPLLDLMKIDHWAPSGSPVGVSLEP